MTLTTAAFFLPISEQMLMPVLSESTPFDKAVEGFGAHHIGALVLLQYLPKLKQGQSLSLDFIIGEAIKIANAHIKRDGKQEFIAELLKTLDRNKIVEGFRLLADFGVALLDDEAVRRRGYLTVEGEWDSAFAARFREQTAESLQAIVLPDRESGLLTTEQTRIYRELSAQLDDHLHVQGYAGTGKSHLVRSLLVMLNNGGASVLVLAERQQQLKVMLAGMDATAGIAARTFESLIREIVPKDLTSGVSLRIAQPTYTQAPISDEAVIKHLDIRSSGVFKPREIVKIVRRTVWSYCNTLDAEFRAKHIPREFGASLDETTRLVVLHHATELWKATLLPPSRDFQPPLRAFHRIKWAALSGLQIPSRYTHVLIDECHDLPAPLVQILDSSSQAVVSLGDEYQNLYGRPQRRSTFVRQRTATHSVRSGHLVESIVNSIITVHPGVTKLPFHGNPFSKTEVHYYERAVVPERSATIVVGDAWGLFEWVQRLAAERLEIELLSNLKDLDMFVTDCLELYSHGTRPRQGELFRFGTWDELAKRYHSNSGFRRIERMIKSGYSAEDWKKSLARLGPHAQSRYAVGLVDDVRNREFDTVMLTPELADYVQDARSTDRASVCSAVYIAVTRARVQRDIQLRPEIHRVWHENFCVYGVRKTWKQLNREHIRVAKCTVRRLMRDLNLRGAIRGKGFKTTIADEPASRPSIWSIVSLRPSVRISCGWRTSPTSQLGAGRYSSRS